MKKNIFWCCSLLVVTSVLFGQQAALTKTGTTAASFLKISLGARSTAMGGAFTAVSTDLSAIYWNPAGLGRLNSGEASFNHIDWIADIKYDNAAIAIPLVDLGTLGLSFTSLNVGEIEVTTTEDPEGTGERYTAGGTLMNISFAKNLTDKFTIGVNIKYIREYLWNMSAQSFAFDFGTLYTAPILNGFHIGASMSNFGPKMKLEGRDNKILVSTGAGGKNIIDGELSLEGYDLPLIFRVGVATDVVQDGYHRVTLAVDAVHPNDNTEYVNSGIEYSWANTIALRGGWKSAFERGTEQGLTFGGGLNYALTPLLNISIDYAYVDFGRLKPVHYLSFGLKF
ncbi:MAG: PorV/PorQ family protein [Bacteriovoracaceae bacterium]